MSTSHKKNRKFYPLGKGSAPALHTTLPQKKEIPCDFF